MRAMWSHGLSGLGCLKYSSPLHTLALPLSPLPPSFKHSTFSKNIITSQYDISQPSGLFLKKYRLLFHLFLEAALIGVLAIHYANPSTLLRSQLEGYWNNLLGSDKSLVNAVAVLIYMDLESVSPKDSLSPKDSNSPDDLADPVISKDKALDTSARPAGGTHTAQKKEDWTVLGEERRCKCGSSDRD
ncbi:MAG: hypothetical protein Q9169_007384 [Polycauliona sp. 2 TL-2023]